MARFNTDALHVRATDLVVKALQLAADTRVAFVNELVADAELTDTELKRLHEFVRKCCEARDKLAISLHTIKWHDPRQYTFDFDDIRPTDFE